MTASAGVVPVRNGAPGAGVNGPRGDQVHANTAQQANSRAAIELQSLTKEFAGFVAVDRVSMRVEAGTVHAIIGPNGAGKTTLFNLITRFLRPTSGRILYYGEDITRARPVDLARRGIVRSFQISAVFPAMTALENVRVALQQPTGLSLRFWKPASSLDYLNARAHELLDLVGIADAAQTPAGELPYGRKRALEIATTLALEPETLLLDEPMSGLGTEDIDRIAGVIRDVAVDRTVVMIEHQMKVVADLSDTITVLQQGAVLAEGAYAEVASNPKVIEAYMGTGDDD